jgi:long-chain acyl-CoA synthetase
MRTIPALVMAHSERIAARPAFHVRDGDGWSSISWAGYGEYVRSAAAALITLGVEQGDAVAILGFNRPEWVVFDVAAMAIGATPAGIYSTNSAAECAHVLSHSQARVALVENEAQWEKIAGIRSELPHLNHIVLMAKAAHADDEMTISWGEFLDLGGSEDEREADRRLHAVQPEDAATLIYTSGTTGPPKGVVLSHQNLAWTARAAVDLFRISPEDTTLSYLPLSHIAEQVFTIHTAAQSGHQVYFARSIESLRADLRAARPSVFFGVPRVWEGIERGVTRELAKLDGPRAAIADRARRVARAVNAARNEGRGPGVVDSVQYEVAKKAFLDRVKGEIGLDRCRLALSGAAPAAADVLESLATVDIVVHEVYGQSEDTGPTTINLPGATRFGTVGRPFPGTEVTLAGDGEVIVAGPHVFAGYLRDEVATKETLVDGRLATGDLGSFDDDGYLTITGRKKEIIVTSGGKNVAPLPIEQELLRHPVIADAVVIGDGMDYLTALIVVDHDELGTNGNAEQLVADAVAAVNEGLAKVEEIRRHSILDQPLSIESGELTPTLKVRRQVVSEHFADTIAAMYPRRR